MLDVPTLIAGTIVCVLAVARATRLLTSDDFPPAMWLRGWYVTHSSQAWAPLITCPFCLAPWLTLVDLTWAALAHLDLDSTSPWSNAWWFANAWFAVAYLASMIVVRDEPE